MSKPTGMEIAERMINGFRPVTDAQREERMEQYARELETYPDMDAAVKDELYALEADLIGYKIDLGYQVIPAECGPHHTATHTTNLTPEVMVEAGRRLARNMADEGGQDEQTNSQPWDGAPTIPSGRTYEERIQAFRTARERDRLMIGTLAALLISAVTFGALMLIIVVSLWPHR